jgi:hypothetical protein
MTRGPDVVLSNSVESLAERYMESTPTCFLCREAPATTPMVYVADAASDSSVRGCVFGVCMVCLCSDDFQTHVRDALRQDQHQCETAAWN